MEVPPQADIGVRGSGCSLIDKYCSHELENVVPTILEEYAFLRYFLWFPITHKWDINILRQSHTREFFLALKNSSYRAWLITFNEPRYDGYATYFKD